MKKVRKSKRFTMKNLSMAITYNVCRHVRDIIDTNVLNNANRNVWDNVSVNVLRNVRTNVLTNGLTLVKTTKSTKEQLEKAIRLL